MHPNRRSHRRQTSGPLLVRFGLLLLLVCGPASAAEPTVQEDLVNHALATLNRFLADPDMGWFKDHLKDAKGLLIVPEAVKAGFVVGASGGNGILLVRDEKTGNWKGPAFYMLGSISFGLQIGGKLSEIVMMVMTEKGLGPLYGSSFTLGGEASVAAGPVGVGAEAATAMNLSSDYLSFARSKGAFAGVSLEGEMIFSQKESNAAYYGKPVDPPDILVSGRVANPQADGLRAAIQGATR